MKETIVESKIPTVTSIETNSMMFGFDKNIELFLSRNTTPTNTVNLQSIKLSNGDTMSVVLNFHSSPVTKIAFETADDITRNVICYWMEDDVEMVYDNYLELFYESDYNKPTVVVYNDNISGLSVVGYNAIYIDDASFVLVCDGPIDNKYDISISTDNINDAIMNFYAGYEGYKIIEDIDYAGVDSIIIRSNGEVSVINKEDLED